MNKQNSNNKLPLLKRSTPNVWMVLIIVLSILILCGDIAWSQSLLNTDGSWHKVSYSGTYKDFILPSSLTQSYVEFRLVGADGGSAKVYGCDRVVGGAGAVISAIFEIGNTDYQIPSGAELRFIVGGGGEAIGEDDGAAAGGGGGTAVLLKISGHSDPYRILAVAGGGGGGYAAKTGGGLCRHDPGNNANTGTSGGTADGNGSFRGIPGNNGEGAEHTTKYVNYGGGGGGAFSDAHYSNSSGSLGQAGKKGGWEGGAGGWQNVTLNGEDWNKYIIKGGYGFGGGGGGFLHKKSTDSGGGGGGGFSGGANGQESTVGTTWLGGGGGGGSYLLPGVYAGNIQVGNRTTQTYDGYIEYRLVAFKSIRLAANSSRCLDIEGGNTTSGTNIQLWDCNTTGTQNWTFDGLNIRLGMDSNKCLDLSDSNTNNGNNIQLYNCNNTFAQHWVYDGVYQLIRSKIDLNKCIRADKGITAAGTSLVIYDCDPTSNAQLWQVDGAVIPPTQVRTVTIRPDYAQDKCLNLSNNSTASGTNVQLWDCDGAGGSPTQRWYIVGMEIRSEKDHTKCLDLTSSNPNNGANIQLYNCNQTKAQTWVYNGLTHEIRSSVDLDKCIDVVNAGTNAGTNIQLWDCKGVGAQHFVLVDIQ